MTPQELIDRKNSSATRAYHQFVLISAKRENSVLYCFFEGNEDGPYYAARICNYFDSCEPIVCCGKQNLLDIFDKIKGISRYDKYRMGFFIDKDYDPPCGIAEIYETPTYSIENFYCSLSFFSRILKFEFHVSEGQPEFDLCVEIFNKLQDEFHESVLLLNAWYYCIRMESLNKGVKLTVCLDDHLPRGFVQFNLPGHILKAYNINDIKELFPDARNGTVFSDSDISGPAALY